VHARCPSDPGFASCPDRELTYPGGWLGTGDGELVYKRGIASLAGWLTDQARMRCTIGCFKWVDSVILTAADVMILLVG